MIHGYFGGYSRTIPLVNADIEFLELGGPRFSVQFVIDTAAGGVTLGPKDAARFEATFGIDVGSLRADPEGISGINGIAPCWQIHVRLWLADRSFDIDLRLLDPRGANDPDAPPSLLGRVILSHYTLVVSWPNNTIGLYD